MAQLKKKKNLVINPRLLSSLPKKEEKKEEKKKERKKDINNEYEARNNTEPCEN